MDGVHLVILSHPIDSLLSQCYKLTTKGLPESITVGSCFVPLILANTFQRKLISFLAR